MFVSVQILEKFRLDLIAQAHTHEFLVFFNQVLCFNLMELIY